jgi:hypothetical protein
MNQLKFNLVMLLSLLSMHGHAETTLYQIVSPTGDTLLIHQLNNQEIWGSFIITDAIADSFNDDELIVMQIDHFQPIKLEHQKLCGGGKGDEQTVSFAYEQDTQTESWLFKSVMPPENSGLTLFGSDAEKFERMRADRRPEVVDFPIEGELAITGLMSQMVHATHITFRYTTEIGEVRSAEFDLSEHPFSIKKPYQAITQ